MFLYGKLINGHLAYNKTKQISLPLERINQEHKLHKLWLNAIPHKKSAVMKMTNVRCVCKDVPHQTVLNGYIFIHTFQSQ